MAERAHEVGRLGVGGHVRPQRRPPTERLPALPARELALARVCHLMGWMGESIVNGRITNQILALKNSKPNHFDARFVEKKN